jgi:hypothetical protein
MTLIGVDPATHAEERAGLKLPTVSRTMEPPLELLLYYCERRRKKKT